MAHKFVSFIKGIPVHIKAAFRKVASWFSHAEVTAAADADKDVKAVDADVAKHI